MKNKNSHNIVSSSRLNSTEYKAGVSKWGSALGAVALSVLATVAANQGDNPPSSNPDFAHSVEMMGRDVTLQSDLGLHDVVPGDSRLTLPGARFDAILQPQVDSLKSSNEVIPVTSEVQQTQTILDEMQLMEWARLFDKDPSAEKTLDKELGIKDTVSQIEKLIDDGWTVEFIELHGHASDEDDTAWLNGGSNPGFGIPSEKNVKLAVKRAKAVGRLLESRLAKSNTANQLANAVTITGGTEVEDPLLANEITDLAAKRGVSAQDLVVRYNRDRDSFSDTDLETLDGLRDDRYVSVKVKVSKLETVTVYKTDEAGNVTETKETKKHVSIVLIPVLIPFIKKRRIEPGEKVIVPPKYPGKPIIPTDRSDRKAKGRTVEPWRLRKQPGQLNNGGNSGSRGQRSTYKLSRHTSRARG